MFKTAQVLFFAPLFLPIYALFVISVIYFLHRDPLAGYRAAKEWAEELGCVDVAELLDQTLAEEIVADQKMAVLGMERINPRVNPNPSPRV